MGKKTSRPFEVKEPALNKWSKGYRFSIITGILGIILGFFVHIGVVSYDNHINRPILSFKIKSLTVAKSSNLDWMFLIVFDQKNTGNSQAIYNIEECNVLFPFLQKSPIKIKYDKSISLNQRSSRIDTIEIPLPIKLESNDPVIFNSLKYINLSIEELRTGTKYISQRDSSDIIFGISSSSDSNSPPNFRQYGTVNPKTGDSIYIRGIQYIQYHNKTYKNFFFPRTAKLDYKIFGDQIQVTFTIDSVQPFLYMPNPEIADKIVFPKSGMIGGSFEDSTETGKAFYNFQFQVKDISNSSNIYYLFDK